ncbi:MAG TPA: glycosyltransferase [Longimicrobiaceae bacterium]|nr:glycosyltransferase [Longimicrobiaceae bacterium]
MQEQPPQPVERRASRRPKVLQIGKYYSPYHGGIETHLQALCEGLREHVDVEVIVSSEDRRSAVDSIGGIDVVRVGTACTLAGAPICPGMIRRIRESDADIVHLHLPNPAAVMAYLASGHRGRLVVSYHSDVVRQRVLDAAFRPIVQLLLDRCDAVVAATPNYIESSPMLSRYRHLCQVIPYGIPIQEFRRRDEEVARIRERFGPRIVLGVGRLVYYKGFEYLVEAMRDVRGHLVIVGDGPLRRPLEERVRALGLEDRVTLLGQVDDTVPFYQAADVFVLASVARSEAFGIVQLEAMACGTPVVNTALDSGVPYVSRGGESGLTVPPAQPAAMAEAINRLLDDSGLRERYGRVARARAELEFSQEVMVSRFVDLYESLLGLARRADPRQPGRSAVRRHRERGLAPSELG